MSQTENISELVTALSKAQGVMAPAKFNKGNPHFKSRYADFTSCMEACRLPLACNGLSVMQYCDTVNDKLVLVTMLAHVSGQWIKSYFPLLPKDFTSQAIGSAMTYAKRYSLSAMLGIVADEEDDDGEATMDRKPECKPALQTAKAPPPPPLISDVQVKFLLENLPKTDDKFKSTLEKWMKDTNIGSYSQLTVPFFESIAKGITENIKEKANENIGS